MFNFVKKKAIENRVQDEILYEYVLDEMEQSIKIKGLWAKAFAHSSGDEAKTSALYMQYRVQSIKDYFTSLKIAYEEMPKEKITEALSSTKEVDKIDKKPIHKQSNEDKEEWWEILS